MNPFLFLGALEAGINTYKDLKYLKIDTRLDSFMYGVIAYMIFEKTPAIWYIFSLIFASAVVGMLMRKKFGVGDVSSIGWMVVGFGLLHPIWLALFLCNFLIMVGFVMYLRKFWLKLDREKKIPGMPILFWNFVLTAGEVVIFTAKTF